MRVSLGSTGVAARTVRANMNLYFAVLTVIVTLALAWQGLLGWRSVWFAASALPAYGVALWAGSRLFWIASDRTFRRVAYGMILASALFGLPLWDGARP